VIIPPTTSDGVALDVDVLSAMPGLAALYATGAASSGRLAAGRAIPGRGAEEPTALTLPTVAHEVDGVPTAGLRSHLRDYQRLLHEPGSELLPSGYLHVLAFPLVTSVMVRGDYPLPLLGTVHVANDASLLRPVALGDVLDVRAWAERLRPHRRGVQLDMVAEIRVAGELAWRGVSTYLSRGYALPEPRPDDDALVVKDPVAEDRAPEGTWTPPLPTARWVLPAGTGRAYGAISGDRNPIHLSALAAKAFGFPRAIAHGMYTAARALAEVGSARGETYRWTVAFGKPVLLPSTVDVAITHEEAGFIYSAWHAGRRQRHFRGEVTPLQPPR
jgi:acyl dehydratase